jgi:hypothetical protein
MMRVLILMAIVALLVVAVLVISLVPLMEVTYSETESYTATEDYYRTETYIEEIPVEYEVTDAEVGNLWWRNSSDFSLVIENTGDVGGYFRIEFDLVTLEKQEINKVAWQYLDTGEKRRVTVRHHDDYVYPYDGSVNASTYSVTPPVKVIEHSRQVPDVREITKYRVTEKTKRVTVLEYFREWR